jgi:glycine betaine/proline transport system substrate-binding protein
MPFHQKLVPVFVAAALVLAFMLPAQSAQAKRAELRFASVGWTCVTTKTDVAVHILETLGYEAENMLLSVPFAYKAMSTGDVDVFLGNWMPSMASIADPYFNDGSVVQLSPIMTEAKYTLAVPTYVAEGGLTDFKDIIKYGEKLDWKIYGIEEGNDGNQIIEAMIEQDLFGLGKFKIIPSSEAGMLAQVRSYVPGKRWIVFLGWSPHSMNKTIDMTYLTGSDERTFGPDDGTANVYINTRKGFAMLSLSLTRNSSW